MVRFDQVNGVVDNALRHTVITQEISDETLIEASALRKSFDVYAEQTNLYRSIAMTRSSKFDPHATVAFTANTGDTLAEIVYFWHFSPPKIHSPCRTVAD